VELVGVMTLKLCLFVAMVGALALLGGVCVFNPLAIVKIAQRNYARSKLTRAWPFSNMVLKPWYPAYLRFMGLFAWAFAALLIYAILKGDAGE
jgi:hypothetical protein